MARTDIGEGQSCAPPGLIQWGRAERPAQSLAGIAYGGRRVRRHFGLVRIPYLAVWLPAWQFEYDFEFGGYRWLRAMLLWRKGLGIRVYWSRHPHECLKFTVTDREIANRRRV